jgi:hypothetical protein
MFEGTRFENLMNMGADSGDKELLAKIRETEATQSSLREQKAAWIERRALKERLLALKEEDLPHILAASGLKLRGEDPAAVDDLLIELLGIDPEKHDLRRDELRGWVCEEPTELDLPQGRVQAPQGHLFIVGNKFMNVDVARLLDEEYSRQAQPRS